MIAATGWRFADVDECGFADLLALLRHWESVPPAYESLAVMAHTYREPQAPGPSSEAEVRRFFAAIP